MHRSILVSLISLAIIFTAVGGEAAIPASGVGARPLGMGKAFVAVSNDINSLFVNPAGLAHIKDSQLTSMYSTLAEDTNYTLLGGIIPVEGGSLGVGYTSLGINSILLTGAGAGGRGAITGSTSYYNNIYQISYGRKIWENLSVGVALKLFSKGLTSVAQSSGSGFDMDVGLLYSPSDALTVGVNQQNTLPIDIAAMNWETGEKESIPSSTKVGISYRPQEHLITAVDADLKRDGSTIFYAGLEWKPTKNLALRLGKDKISSDPSEGSYTAGLGLDINGVDLDYAYYLGSTTLGNSAHYFSFSYGKEEKAADVAKVIPEVVEEKIEEIVEVPPAISKKIAIEPVAEEGLVIKPQAPIKPLVIKPPAPVKPVEKVAKKPVAPEKGKYLYLLGQSAKHIHTRKFEKARKVLAEYLTHYPYSRYAKHLIERVDKRIAAVKEVKWVLYKVEKGDSLWGLSKKYFGDSYGYVELAAYNKLKPPYKLSKGDKIFVPQQKLPPVKEKTDQTWQRKYGK